MGKNLDKKISTNLSIIYSQKLLDHAKQSVTDAVKTASKNQFKTTETTADLTDSKIANNITSLKKLTTEYFRDSEIETPKERYISPE